MGLLNKLMFWKKEDDFDFDGDIDKNLTSSGLPPMDDLGLNSKPEGINERSPFDPPQTYPEEPTSAFPTPGTAAQTPGPVGLTPQPTAPRTSRGDEISKQDLELISSKLDTIKAQLNAIEQRLTNLEKAAGVHKQQHLW